MHNLLFCVHTLCMNYETNTLLLVSSSVRSKQLLCFVQGQGQKSEQKHTTKNFEKFHNHSPLLTMLKVRTVLFFQLYIFYFISFFLGNSMIIVFLATVFICGNCITASFTFIFTGIFFSLANTRNALLELSLSLCIFMRRHRRHVGVNN